MNLVEVVILVGAQCLSPVESGPGITEAGKVPCAVLIRHDPDTAEIDIVPASAATDPDVIAMLVKPRAAAHAMKGDRQVAEVAAGKDRTGSITRAPRIVPASAAGVPDEQAPEKAKPAVKKKRVEKPAAQRKHTAAARGTACGSYKAVWFTNKEGRRRYRCVKSG